MAVRTAKAQWEGNIQQGKGLRPKWLDESLRAAGLLKEGETL